MRLIPVKSSNVVAIGHDGSELRVRFKGGNLYAYEGVPASVFQAFLKAPSVGSFFATRVRGRFTSRKLEDEAMTTTVVITTQEGDKQSSWSIAVGEQAQKHVLRKFNVTGDPKVDATKVLCAALIQQMIDLRDAPDTAPHVKRACSIGITQVELVQMPLVKANFVEA